VHARGGRTISSARRRRFRSLLRTQAREDFNADQRFRVAAGASSLFGMSLVARSCVGMILGTAVILLSAAPAAACTVCDSANGQAVREAFVEDDDFTVNLMAATLPSLAFAGVVALVHFGWPARERRGGAREDRT
jgi:hypothetical protein